jgi:hypothetical protein
VDPREIRARDLPERLGDDVRRRLEADRTAADRLEALRASDDEIRAQLPPFARIEERARRSAATARGRGWRWLLMIPVLAAAGLAVMLLRPADVEGPARLDDDYTRIKGSARLTIYRQTSSGAEPLADNAAAHSGEILQIGYAASAHRHGVILSLDGRGRVTLHHPDSLRGSTVLGSKGTLTSAYQLDDAPEFERFILVTSRSPVPIERVIQAAQSLASQPGHGRQGNLDLPSDLAQTSLLIRKAQP